MVLGSPKVRKGMMCIRPSRTSRSDCWGRGEGGGGGRERERKGTTMGKKTSEAKSNLAIQPLWANHLKHLN